MNKHIMDEHDIFEENELPEDALSATDGKDSPQDGTEYTDGNQFAARYESAKERDMEKLSKKMEERESGQRTKKQKRNAIIKIVLMCLLIGLSIGIMFGINKYVNDGKSMSFTRMLRETFNYRYFLALIACVLCYIFMESLKYSYLLRISMGKWRLKNSLKTFFLGKYYDYITPLGTGGQPFQIYYLHKRNVPAGVATAVPLVKYIVTTFVFGGVSIVMLAIAPDYFRDNAAIHSALTTTFMVIAWISLFVNLLIPTIMLFVSSFPKAGKKLIAWFVMVLTKLHLVKHKLRTMQKYVREVNEYRSALKLLIKKWYMLLPMLLICLASMALYLSIPFFSALSIAGAGENAVVPSGNLLLQIWCLAVLSYYTASLVPTPGNSGASETASSFVFATVGLGAALGWTILLWRFANFYLYIVMGVGMSVYSMIRSAIRARRARRQA